MTPEESIEFNKTHPVVEHSRPEWTNEEYHALSWKDKSVTVICTQRKTKNAIQLTIESLLRFYPNILIVIADDNSLDDSAQYLQYKELVTPNLTVWMRTEENSSGRHGHGRILHELIEKFVRTKYVLTLDSDMVIEKGGFVELMIAEFEKDNNLYGLGTLHYGSYQNNGGEPFTPEDAVPYAHPQLSMFRVDKYNETETEWIEDGAPLILNMKEAKDLGWRVDYFPTDKYASHRGGSSYVEPRPVWESDHDVFLRPFVTFITSSTKLFFTHSIDSDFDIVIAKNPTRTEVVIHGREPQVVGNYIYDLRFHVTGEFVCDVRDNPTTLDSGFITRLKDEVIKLKAPEELTMDGLKFVKRKVWQKNDSLK